MTSGESEQSVEDRRRGIRLQCALWVGVEGVDDKATQRNANISTTGLYFESEHSLGQVGSIQWVSLEASDRQCTVQLLARIVRCLTIVDLDADERTGTALEFLPETNDTRTSLAEFVRHVFTTGLVHGAPVAPMHVARSAAVSSAITAGISIANTESIEVHRLILESDWSPEVGQPVRFDLRSAGCTATVEGQVSGVKPRREGDGYRVAIEVDDDYEGDDVSLLFSEMFAVSEAPKNLTGHLSGMLSRIKLPTLLSLIEMERLSGSLEIEREDEIAKIWADGGRLVDAELAFSTDSARAVIAVAMSWDEGAFRFRVEACDRQDKLRTQTTALLLDLAREADEAKQRRA